MKHEILALVPGAPAIDGPDCFRVKRAEGATAILVPMKSRVLTGKALRRHRLSAAARRQAWLEALMPAGPVLAFAPGARIKSDEVPALVRANRVLLDSLTERLQGRVQFQISVSWTEEEVLTRFRTAPEIAPLFAGPTVASADLTRAVSALAARLSRTIAAHLAPVACDIADLPLDTGMVTNHVVLVRSEREPDLDSALEAIDAIWTEGFTIRQIGPAPASSFATLRLRRHRPREVKRAHQCLGLSGAPTDADIQRARQACLRMPDVDAAQIRHATRLSFAAHVTGSGEDVLLLDQWSEGQATWPKLERVA